jgi:hypothetical protein
MVTPAPGIRKYTIYTVRYDTFMGRGLKRITFFSKIFVKAYDLVEEERDGKRYQKLIDGGQIELSNFKTSGHGVHGRVSVE